MNQVGLSAAFLDLEQYRRAQSAWAAQPVAVRLNILRRFRQWLATNPNQLTDPTAMARGVSSLEALATEVLPLADACRWLETEAKKVLATKRPAGKRSLWMRGIDVQVRREPLGLVLLIAPGNYPLLLAGIQTLQALVAGNAVLLKPAPGNTQLLTRFRDALLVAGLPMDLLTLLPEDPECVAEVLVAPGGPDHVVITGSSRTGRAVQQQIADAARPIGLTAELSGADVCILLPGVNLAEVAQALRFATGLNRGRTCIAPRMVLVPADRESELLDRLRSELANFDCGRYGHTESRHFAHILSLAVQLGAELVHIENSPVAVLRNLPLHADFPWDDLFSPLLFVVPYRSIPEAIAIQQRIPQALGASIFGPASEAHQLAAELNCGFVTINDVVAPTADPRVSMSARRASGQGVTRGAEGLLAMTVSKSVVTQRSRFRPHWHKPQPQDLELLSAMLSFEHAGWEMRWESLKRIIRLLSQRTNKQS